MATEQQIREIKQRHGPALMKQAGISGVGIEKDEQGGYVLAVHASDPKALASVPEQIEGVPVKRVHSGPFVKLPDRA